MSTNFLRIIPTVPGWIPDDADVEAAKHTLGELCVDARDLTAECSDEIKFVDQGGNFQAIRCPHCSQELTLEWWHDRMDRAFERAFTDLSIVTPCCTELSSLNDLEYDLPAGFARFVLEAESPGCGWLSSVELSQIATDLGHPVRPIWARY